MRPASDLTSITSHPYIHWIKQFLQFISLELQARKPIVTTGRHAERLDNLKVLYHAWTKREVGVWRRNPQWGTGHRRSQGALGGNAVKNPRLAERQKPKAGRPYSMYFCLTKNFKFIAPKYTEMKKTKKFLAPPQFQTPPKWERDTPSRTPPLSVPWRLNSSSTPGKNWQIQHCAPNTNSWLRLWNRQSPGPRSEAFYRTYVAIKAVPWANYLKSQRKTSLNSKHPLSGHCTPRSAIWSL